MFVSKALSESNTLAYYTKASNIGQLVKRRHDNQHKNSQDNDTQQNNLKMCHSA
jgi:hypothetical protein